MLQPKFQIIRSEDRLYYINLVDIAGNILYTSSGFYNKQEAWEGIDQFKRIIFNAKVSDLTKAGKEASCA